VNERSRVTARDEGKGLGPEGKGAERRCPVGAGHDVGTGPIGLVLALNVLIIKKIRVLTPVDYGSPDNFRGNKL